MDNKRETSSVVDELNRLDGQIDAAPDLNALKPIFYRLEEITKDNSADLDVQKRVSGIKQHLMSRGRELKPEGGVTTGSNPLLASHTTGSLGIAMSATGAPPVPSMPTSSYPAQIDHTLPLPNPGRTAPEESVGNRTESMREVYVPPVRTPPPPSPPASAFGTACELEETRVDRRVARPVCSRRHRRRYSLREAEARRAADRPAGLYRRSVGGHHPRRS